MDYNASFHISAAGMTVEKMRLDVTASNLANMHTTAAPGTALYQPLRVISREVPLSFSEHYGTAAGSAGAVETVEMTGGGAQVAVLAPMEAPPTLVYEPGHPDADSKGFVSYPGINQTSEMVNMMSALRAYEANVVAMNAAKTMAQRALEIGGQA